MFKSGVYYNKKKLLEASFVYILVVFIAKLAQKRPLGGSNTDKAIIFI